MFPANSSQSVINALRSVPFFSELPHTELLELSRSVVRRRYSAGQVIFHLGDPGGLLYVVESGKIKIYLPNGEGQEMTLAILGETDFFGELALFDDSPRSATAEAIDQTWVYTLHREEFIRYIHSNPDFTIRILSTLAKRLRGMNEKISDVFFLDLLGRLARRLLQLSLDHGEKTSGGILIQLPLTQTDLAEMTGSTRVSVNKAIGRFRNAGWVSVKGRKITIHNSEALRRLIHFSAGDQPQL